MAKAKKPDTASVKKGDFVEVVALFNKQPIFVGRVKRVDPSKKFAYVYGRFDSQHLPCVKGRKNAELINVSLENIRLTTRLS